ncbi:MAG: zinc ribbon domain-containing protein [Phycisphaerae bacterium]|jgi:predicted  nucleic acid-binding Zn-ribbon protein
MGPLLEGLYKLQIEEDKLRGMTKRLERANRAVVLQENKLAELESELALKGRGIVRLKAESDAIDLEIKSREETVEKYKAALNTARNNRDYAAILTELNTNKADNSKLENKSLEIMQMIENEQKLCEELKAAIEEQKQLIEDVKARAAGRVAECTEAIEEISKQWEVAAKALAPDVLELFKRLAGTYEGSAVSYIEQADPRRELFHCNGCFMSLTSETWNRLLTQDEIIRCPSCGRIVVINPLSQ